MHTHPKKEGWVRHIGQHGGASRAYRASKLGGGGALCGRPLSSRLYLHLAALCACIHVGILKVTISPP